MALSTIGMLWMEGRLSYLEQLCIKSFLDAGHRVVLHHYGPLENVPDGVELEDASIYLPHDGYLTHKKTNSPAIQADQFRYRMLKAVPDIIWADTDAYCEKPFVTDTGHFHGWESKSHINNGVLGLPQDSDTLNELLEFTSDEYSIPEYFGADYERELREKAAAGTPVHVSEQPWGAWGPRALSHFLKKTGEVKYSMPIEALYPVSFKDRRSMLKPNFDMTGLITDDTFSVHFYGRRMRKRLVEKEGGLPHPESLIGKLLVKHNIDPAKAPLPMPTPKPEVVEPVRVDRTASLTDLTDLADQRNLDNGTRKHRFTEVYDLLLRPRRETPLQMLELGDHGRAAASLKDLPQSALWLDYLPQAQLFRLDGADLSAAATDRFSPQQVDLSDRASLSAVGDTLPDLDVILDDASHASHHQQFAFLALWRKLKSGGIYLIEDLRGQPEALERDGFTKTGELFYGFQTEKQFQHSDPQIQAEFAAIASEISGCFLFQAGFNRNKRHQIAVIHKR